MADQSAGDILRAERLRRRLTLAKAGALVGYSPSTLSRIELGRRRLDIDSLLRLAEHYGIPPSRLGLATVNARHSGDESGDEMRRRQFLTAAAVITVVPASVLTRLDDALVALPGAQRPVTAQTVRARLAASRALFDAASYTTLVAGLPELLAAAHELADTSKDPAAPVCVAACYDLATHILNKIGRHQASRLTADRAMAYACQSGSPLAIALSSRALGVVLRHEHRPLIARRVNLAAISAVEATGLITLEQRTVLTQMLCSAAYSAGQGADRVGALELIGTAERVVRDLPDREIRPGGAAPITPAQVQLYKVGVHWALGDSARALHAALGLRARSVPHPRTPRPAAYRPRPRLVAARPTRTSRRGAARRAPRSTHRTDRTPRHPRHRPRPDRPPPPTQQHPRTARRPQPPGRSHHLAARS
ncbi:MAG TPA: helix-turn-helix transcriptional regulator [Pseudonocardiaceae bacterium]|nr:helix-turn-helix transcriptional regulator [Pseudonocardiaceae bacterium]